MKKTVYIRPKNHKKPLTKDPTKILRIERRYERKLIGLFNDYKGWIRTTLNKFRTLATENPITDPNIIISSAREAMKYLVLDKAGNVVDSTIPLAYWNGKLFSDEQAKSLNIPPTTSASISVLFNAPVHRETIDILRQRNTHAIQGITDETNKAIGRELTDGVLSGEGIPDLTKRLVSVIDDVSIPRARTIARTEVMYASNKGIRKNWETMGFSKFSWKTHHDERTCDICGPLDGKIIPDEQPDDPPAHPNCRCIMLPVIEKKEKD